MKHIPSQQEDKAWEKMQIMLDQHLPVKKKNNNRWIILFFFGMALLSLGYYWNKIYNQSQSDTQVFAMNDSQDSKKNHTLSQTEICPENTNVNNKINDYINGQRVVISNKNTSRKNINSEISNKQYSSESDQNLNAKSEVNVSENRSNEIVEKLIIPACTSIKYENKPFENNLIDSVQYQYTESLVATKKKINTSFLVRPLIGSNIIFHNQKINTFAGCQIDWNINNRNSLIFGAAMSYQRGNYIYETISSVYTTNELLSQSKSKNELSNFDNKSSNTTAENSSIISNISTQQYDLLLPIGYQYKINKKLKLGIEIISQLNFNYFIAKSKDYQISIMNSDYEINSLRPMHFIFSPSLSINFLKRFEIKARIGSEFIYPNQRKLFFSASSNPTNDINVIPRIGSMGGIQLLYKF
ncbi:MAG TPA: hypothetical protein PK622_08775 [Saprospiraceae bacterium]|jgi:hypothetical protein|nr:hypothetical protein [Saprospiraceae bacterium]